MIGSKRKVLSVYRALEKDGIAPEKFASVHAPGGLDIGALTPEEIAISITAELIAIRRGSTNLSHKAVNHVNATPPSVRGGGRVSRCTNPLRGPCRADARTR